MAGRNYFKIHNSRREKLKNCISLQEAPQRRFTNAESSKCNKTKTKITVLECCN